MTEVGVRGARLYFVLRVHDNIDNIIPTGRTQGAAAEEDAVRSIGEQQAEVDAVRSDHARLVLARDTSYHTRRQSRGPRQTHTDVVKEVRRQKHNYVYSKERTVVRRAVLTQIEERAPSISAL